MCTLREVLQMHNNRLSVVLANLGAYFSFVLQKSPLLAVIRLMRIIKKDKLPYLLKYHMGIFLRN